MPTAKKRPPEKAEVIARTFGFYLNDFDLSGIFPVIIIITNIKIIEISLIIQG